MRRQLVGFAKAAATYPLTLLSRAGKPKDAYIRLDMDFLGILGGGHCYVRNTPTNSKGLEEAYILFMARVLSIIPENQQSLVLQVLEALTSITGKHNFRNLNEHIYREVVGDLSKDQQDAAKGLFAALIPLTIMKEDPPGPPGLASYTFTVARDFKTHFRMSMGPDVILLPLSISLLYEYVSSEAGEGDVKRLNNNINEIITTIPEAGPGRAWEKTVQNHVLQSSSNS
jgi:hypothetical protein